MNDTDGSDVEQILEECDLYIKELKFLDGKEKIFRVMRLCPQFVPFEVCYQTYRAKYSDAYFAIWSYNVGPCLYDACLRHAPETLLRRPIRKI